MKAVPEGADYSDFDPRATYGDLIRTGYERIDKKYFKRSISVLRKKIEWSIPPQYRNRIGYIIFHPDPRDVNSQGAIAYKCSPDPKRRGESELTIMKRLKS